MALIGFMFDNRAHIKPLSAGKFAQTAITFVVVVISLGIGIYTINFLPFIDFLPYKKGNNLPDLMTLPEGEIGDQYEVIYTLKNKTSDEEKKVSDKVYLAEELWKDENWEIIGDPESKLVKKGYQVPIPDLLISNANGDDVTQELIENPYYNLVVVAWDLDKTNLDALQDINEIVLEAAESYNIRSILLTAGSTQQAQSVSDDLDLLTEIFYADAVPLKSMVRANPGVLLMRKGTVIDKWHYHTIPDFETLDKLYFSTIYEDE